MGLTMKHAGVAITVTSLTDTCAFLVGCGTVYPGLQSFSLSCGIGILAIYVLQLTWFTAWLSIDTMRINSNRNACFSWSLRGSRKRKWWVGLGLCCSLWKNKMSLIKCVCVSLKLTWFYPFLRFWKKDSAIVGISSSPKWRDLEVFLFGLVTKGMPNERFVSIL